MEPTERPPAPPPISPAQGRAHQRHSPEVQAAAQRSATRRVSPRLFGRRGGAAASADAAAAAPPHRRSPSNNNAHSTSGGGGGGRSDDGIRRARHNGREEKSQSRRIPPAPRRPLPALARRERAIRPANAGTFASGRSSYNLNFVDWENEWETYLDDGPPGGYDTSYSSDEHNDEDSSRPAAGGSWLEEHRMFWKRVDLVVHAVDSPHSAHELLDYPDALLDALTTFGASESSNSSSCRPQGEWSWDRIRRLDQAVAERGGFAPLRAVKLRQGPYYQLAARMTPADPDAAGSDMCGICLESIEDDHACFELCHPFHVDCIRPWFLRSQGCPLCRRSFEDFASS